ncbi:hypothetical protein [Pseudomonas sp. UBA4194]|uniref:hypothetical protein n=1 Tax=Pseudomonas sp. UBA4194 TaxID=1947317 RepID=UPI0025EF9164|nr:hypothetical protein [Pseudomonas sp. UBA4194]
MAVNSIDPSAAGAEPASGETEFNAAVDSATGMTDEEFTDTMITGAITVAGQMIIMPKANEILNEGMSDE